MPQPSAASASPSLRGVIPPLVTPLTRDRELDVTSLVRLVNRIINAGADGVFALGSSGEGAFLSDSQRREVIDVVIATTAGRVPVLVGAVDTASGRVIEQARAAAASGADGIVVTAPFYGQVSTVEVAAHFREIADAIGSPIVAYDNPAVVNTTLDTAMLIELANSGAISAVKDSSGDDARLRRLVMDTRDLPDFAVFTGSEVTTDSALHAGADGVVPGLSNVDIDGYVRLYRAARAGQWDTARTEQERLIRLFGIVEAADRGRVGRLSGGVGAFKVAMAALGIIDTARLCRPFADLIGDERDRIVACLGAAGLGPAATAG